VTGRRRLKLPDFPRPFLQEENLVSLLRPAVCKKQGVTERYRSLAIINMDFWSSFLYPWRVINTHSEHGLYTHRLQASVRLLSVSSPKFLNKRKSLRLKLEECNFLL
jgi:hypothetical protein